MRIKSRFLLCTVSILLVLTILPVAFFQTPKIASADPRVWETAYTEMCTNAYSITTTDEGTVVVGCESNIMYSADGTSFSSALALRGVALSNITSEDHNIFAGTNSDGLYKSSDGGATWSEANNAGIPDGNNVLDVEYMGSGLVFAANYSDGQIQCSPDGGTNWSSVLSCTRPRALRYTASKLWVACDSGLYRVATPTSCTGLSFEEATGESWTAPLDILPGEGTDIFVATTAGVYKGNWSTWTQEWSTGRVNSLLVSGDSLYPYLAATQDYGVIGRDTSGTWATYGTSLGLTRVYQMYRRSGDASEPLYAAGQTNGSTTFPVWLTEIPGPTAIDLVYLTATQDASIKTRTNFAWGCYEDLNVGFNIWWLSPKRGWVLVNHVIIPGAPGGGGGGYSEYTYYQPNHSAGDITIPACPGDSHWNLRDFDSRGWWTDHYFDTSMTFQQLSSFSAKWNHTTEALDWSWASGTEVHNASYTRQYAVGTCANVDDGDFSALSTTTATHAGQDLGHSYSGSTYFYTLQPAYCVRIKVNPYYSNDCYPTYSSWITVYTSDIE